MATTETDIQMPDGRTLHVYDTGHRQAADGADGFVVVWHHGTPNVGAPPTPLFPAGDRLVVRWVAYDRPGYGGSTPLPDRDVASAASDVRRIADALGIGRFTTIGHSSGGAHALACAALIPDRVTAAVSVSGLAPYGAASAESAGGLDWFAGIGPGGVASLAAAVAGRDAKERFEASGGGEGPEFTAADEAALEGPWSWFMTVVQPAVAAGMGGLIADDLASVRPWGFAPEQISVPVLLLHGEADRVVPAAHARWVAGQFRSAELKVTPGDGHISVLSHAPAALEWLRAGGARRVES